MNITIALLAEHQDALKEKFGANENIAYANVSKTQLSIARHYGGCDVNGSHYTYNPTDDSLIRDDVLKWMAKRVKTNTKMSRAESAAPTERTDSE